MYSEKRKNLGITDRIIPSSDVIQTSVKQVNQRVNKVGVDEIDKLKLFPKHRNQLCQIIQGY